MTRNKGISIFILLFSLYISAALGQTVKIEDLLSGNRGSSENKSDSVNAIADQELARIKAAKEREESERLRIATEKKSNETKLETLEKALKCEEANQFTDALKSDVRPYFSINSCTADRQVKWAIASKNPQTIYIAATKFETVTDRGRAEALYKAIIDSYPSSLVAVRATDRLNAITYARAAEQRQADAIRIQSSTSSEQQSPANASSFSQGSTNKRFSCSFKCRSGYAKEAGRHTISSYGATEMDARESIRGDAERLCKETTQSLKDVYRPDMSICHEN